MNSEVQSGGPRSIPLTRGYAAMVDAADWPRVAPLKWSAFVNRRNGRVYARSMTLGRNVWMHRFILGVGDGADVDHRNGDGLDNQRENLRACTSQQNQMNRGPNRNNRSGFKGVRQFKGRWSAQIRTDGKSRHLGYYDTAEEAAGAYDRAAAEHFGEFAWLNFPDAKSE